MHTKRSLSSRPAGCPASFLSQGFPRRRRAVLRAAVVAVLAASAVLWAPRASAVATGFTYTVNVTTDAAPTTGGQGSGTTGDLRFALAQAEANINSTVMFAVTGTITLEAALPAITVNTKITGPGADKLTISGQGKYQVFSITGGTVSISGLTIANGSISSGDGGGIENAGTLTLLDCAVSGNNASPATTGGGGIYNSGTLAVMDSTISGNTETNGSAGGGGILNNGGTLTVLGSTVSGNTASGSGAGGGIENSGTLTVTNSTLSGNTAVSGGGIDFGSGTSNAASNSIVAENTAPTNADVSGAYTDKGGNLVGTSGINLAGLGNYGGPTQTMLPLPGSPALCAGQTALAVDGGGAALTTDQRGFALSTPSYCSSGQVDAGAVQTNYTSLQFPASASYSEVTGSNVSPAPVVSVTENGQNIGGVPVTLVYTPSSGTATATGTGPITTAAGTGATFSVVQVTTGGNTAQTGNFSATLQLTSTKSLSTASPGPVLTVETPITVTPATLTPGMVGESYSAQFGVTGGTGTITYSITSGATALNNAGLTLDSNSGVLSGTPNTAGSYAFTVKAADAVQSGSQTYTLTVTQATTAITLTSADTTNPSEPSGSSFVNDSVTFTATLTPAGPGVTFAKNVSFVLNGNTSSPVCSSAVTVTTSGSTTAAATCTLSNLKKGTNYVVASYPSGDNNYSAATSATFTQTVGAGGTTTAFVGSSGTSTVDGSVTFTVQVSATSGKGSGVPSVGTVAFSSDGAGISACSAQPITAGSKVATASCTINDLTATSGTPHSITAVYSGDSTSFSGSTTTSAFLQTVNKAATSVAVSSAGAVTVNQAVTLTATVTPTSPVALSTGTVAFSDGGTPISGCTAQAINVSTGQATCTATFVTAGAHAISAAYSGDSNYEATVAGGETSATQSVNKANSAVNVSSSGSSNVNGSVTFTATVTPYSGTSALTSPFTGAAAVTGNITFSSNGTNLCTPQAITFVSGNYQASCTTSSLPAGSPTILAAYSGDANYIGSNNNTTQTVGKTATVVVVSTAGATTVNQPVALTATVTPNAPVALSSGGTVAFSDGSTAISGCSTQPINTSTGQATCSATFQTAGTHTIYAVYSGDSNYAATLQAAVTAAAQTVNAAATAVSVSSPGASTVDQQVTFTAAITPYDGATPLSSPFTGAEAVTGSVTFSYNGSAVCTGAPVSFTQGNYQATCSVSLLPAGSPAIVATYSGDANYSGSTGQVTQKVTAGASSVSLTSSLDPSVVLNPQNVNDAVNLTATVSPSSGPVALSGSVTFTANGAPIAECQSAVPVNPSTGVASCVTKSLGAGAHTILAVYNSDANFTSSSSSITQAVEDYTLAVSPASAVTVSQGFTNSSDLFTPQAIAVSATPISGFTGTLALTCNVVAVSAPAGAVLPTCSVANASMPITAGATPSPVEVTIDAGSGSNPHATPGTYSISITGADTNTGLTRSTASLQVNIRTFAGPLTLISGATTGNTIPISFTLPANVGLSGLTCASVSGPTLTSSVAPVALGIACAFSPGSIPSSGTIQNATVTVTINTGTGTTALLNDSNTTLVTASMVGLPILLLLGLMPGGRKSRKLLCRYLGLACVLVLLLQGTGCGGGHFTAPPSNSGQTPPGSYNILVQGTGTDHQIYQAVIQLNVTR